MRRLRTSLGYPLLLALIFLSAAAGGPSFSSFYGLADFGTVRFTGATADLNGDTGPISAFSPIAVQMSEGSKAVRAFPGPLNPTGEDFTDTWYAN